MKYAIETKILFKTAKEGDLVFWNEVDSFSSLSDIISFMKCWFTANQHYYKMGVVVKEGKELSILCEKGSGVELIDMCPKNIPILVRVSKPLDIKNSNFLLTTLENTKSHTLLQCITKNLELPINVNFFMSNKEIINNLVRETIFDSVVKDLEERDYWRSVNYSY